MSWCLLPSVLRVICVWHCQDLPRQCTMRPIGVWAVRGFQGALDWIRTSDLPLRRRLLYPLSYEGGARVDPSGNRTRLPILAGGWHALLAGLDLSQYGRRTPAGCLELFLARSYGRFDG